MRRTWFWLLLPLALGSVGCGPQGPDEVGSSGSGLSADADADGIPDATEDALMRQYAPEVRLHPDDWALPANVDWYLPKVTMRFSHPHCPDHQVLAVGAATQGNLSTQSHHTSTWWCGHSSTVKRSSDDVDAFFLQPPNDAVHTGIADATKWRVYAHVKKSSTVPGGFDLQYWFFYAYDFTGVLDLNHEADWEHVTYTVDANGTLVSAYYAEHNYGVTFTPDQLAFDQGHPVVYSAVGTHASYTAAGEWPTHYLTFTDHTADGGPVWETWKNVVNVGEKNAPRNGQGFIRYGGRWGEIGINNGSPDIGTSGPQGPAFHPSWSAL